MSSLAATQADGYYVPPEYYESGQYKKQSRNKFNGSKGHNQFEQRGVVRFELPHDGFCLECGKHVSKGTRFNASKHEAGNYFTTKIYEFHMKCRACANCKFIIRTNPKERDFDYVEGIHRQVKEFDTNDAGTHGVLDTNDGNRIVSTDTGTASTNKSGLARLEKVAIGKRKTMTEHEELQALMINSHEKHHDDAASNAALRKTFRRDRHHRKERLRHGKAMGWKEGMELSEETIQDVKAARATCFRNVRQEERVKFKKLRSDSIFSNTKTKKKRRRLIPQDCPSSDSSALNNKFVTQHNSSRKASKCGKETSVRPVEVKSSFTVASGKVSRSPGEPGSKITSSSLAALASYASDSD